LHARTEKGKTFVWTAKCQNAFEELKKSLIEAPVLAHPDFEKPFILDTDARENTERIIAYASRTPTKAERKYCVKIKELLAVVNFVKHFKHYLYGRPFFVRTDHGSLRLLTNFKNPEGQLARWLEILSEYSMTIEHRPGVAHRNADVLSRIPCRQCEFLSGWEESPQANVKTIGKESQEESPSIR